MFARITRITERVFVRVLLLSIAMLIVGISITISLRAQTPTTTPPQSPSEFIQQQRQRGEYHAALYYVQAQAAATGWTPELHRTAADLWQAMGQMQNAVPHWESILTQSTATQAPDVNLLRTLADVYLQRGDWERAFARLEPLVEQMPADGWGQYHIGALLAPSAPAKARAHLEQVRLDSSFFTPAERLLAILNGEGNNAASPDSVLQDMQLGAVLAHANEWALAENAFSYAAAINHPYPEALAYVGLMRAQQGKRGQQWIDEAVRLAPEDANVQYVAGVYWRTLQDFDKSIAALEQAITLQPDIPAFFAELGFTYQLMGDFNQARITFETAQELAGDDADIAGALQDIYSDETYMLPLNYLRVVLEEGDPTLLAAEGWRLHQNGDTDAGLSQVNEALNLDPQNPRARFEKARILLDTGRPDEASLLLRRLVADNTLYATAAQRLLDTLNDE